jgi:hypothetical protein
LQLSPWIVVPFSRPHLQRRVIANIKRQRAKASVLIIEHKCSVDWPQGFSVISSKGSSVGEVKNDGLRWLRDNIRHPYVIAMDDDDFYGDGYVSEHLELARPGVAWCKKGMWAQLDSGLTFFPGIYGFKQEVNENPNGATLGFFLRDVGGYDENVPAAEELGILKSLQEKGGHLLNSSPRHFCCVRIKPEEHTWKASEEKFRRYMGVGVNMAPKALGLIRSVVYGPGTFA